MKLMMSIRSARPVSRAGFPSFHRRGITTFANFTQTTNPTHITHSVNYVPSMTLYRLVEEDKSFSSLHLRRSFQTQSYSLAKVTFQTPKSLTPVTKASNQNNNEPADKYLVIYSRPKTNQTKWIAILMIFFGLACLMQADTSWRYKIHKVNQLIRMDIGSDGMLPSTATSSKIPSYIRAFTQSEVTPSDGKIKTFLVVYGNTLMFSVIGLCLLFGTKFAMRHFGVVELGFFPGTGKGKIVLSKWHGFSYIEHDFNVRDASFMNARAATNGILLHNMEDVAVKMEDQIFYYRLPLGDNSHATFDEEGFQSMVRQSGKKFKISK